MMPAEIPSGAGTTGGFGAAFVTLGSFSVKAVPLPTVLSTRMRP